MQKIVGIRFKPAGKVYYFDPQQIYLKVTDKVIVETARGVEFGEVASKVGYMEEGELKHPIKPVIRKATYRDEKTHLKNLEKAENALAICEEQIQKHQLNMKLINCEYTFDNSKVIFYFTADGRIDFRELVKDLAAIFKIRIELRQIGVRDEAKTLGGIGPCGCGLCCNKWMGDFQPVSIKMAKEQGLSLNPTKISGICGRLLCCLQFEQDCYEENLSELPSVGQKVKIQDGMASVVKLNPLMKKLTVKMDSDNHLYKEISVEDILEVKPKERNCPCKNKEAKLSKKELEELKHLENDKFSNKDDF